MRHLLVIAFCACLLPFCTNKTIELDVPPVEDYFPLTAGKFITYRLDSTVPTAFGADTTVRSYRVRYQFNAEITDGLGRPAMRIFRTISNLNGTTPYTPDNTFTATNVGGQQIEWMENNLRYLKLRAPIREGFSWPGNSYIETSSLNTPYAYLADWQYTYGNVGQPFTVLGKTYNNTITVYQRDEVNPPGPFDKQGFKQWNYSVEVYAKDIGLIYKNTDHKVWQPPTGPPENRPGFWTDDSYRILLRIIDHN